MKDWHKHFCDMLEGRDESVIGEKRNIREDDKEELANEEIKQQIQNLKNKNQGVQMEYQERCYGIGRELNESFKRESKKCLQRQRRSK